MPNKRIENQLTEIGIDFVKREHPAVFTVEEAESHFQGVPGGHTKNLFLRDKKKTQYYLAVVESEKKVDLKALSKQTGENNLSFGSPEMLMELLNVTPGSVSPFGLMFDEENCLKVIIDADLWQYDTLHFHPNINTATLEVKREDFRKFLDWCGHEVQTLTIPERS